MATENGTVSASGATVADRVLFVLRHSSKSLTSKQIAAQTGDKLSAVGKVLREHAYGWAQQVVGVRPYEWRFRPPTHRVVLERPLPSIPFYANQLEYMIGDVHRLSLRAVGHRRYEADYLATKRALQTGAKMYAELLERLLVLEGDPAWAQKFSIR